MGRIEAVGGSLMIGTIVALKVTGERVFVLGENPTTVNGMFYSVRRPVVGPNGITHIIESFSGEELESVEESVRRELNDILMKRKLEQEIYEQYQAEQNNKQAKTLEDATETTEEEKKSNLLKFTN